MTDDNSTVLDRRTVLKTTGGSLVALGGVGTATAATPDPLAWIIPDDVITNTGEEYEFSGKASLDPAGSGITSYEWTVTRGGVNGEEIATGSGPTFTCEFPDPDSYIVWLRVRAPENRVGDYVFTAEVGGENAPIPNFYLEEPIISESKDSNAETTLDAGNAFARGDRTITDYNWSIDARWKTGNNSGLEGASGEQPSYQFPRGGKYLVYLQLTDSAGATNTYARHYDVVGENDQPPALQPRWPVEDGGSVRTGEELTFDARSARDPDGGELDVTWNATINDQYENYDTRVLTKRVTEPGSATVWAEATDDEGQETQTDKREFSIEEYTFATIENLPEKVSAGESVSATGEVTVADDQTFESHLWNLYLNGEFVDSSSDRTFESKPLTEPGTYTLNLKLQLADDPYPETSAQFTVTPPVAVSIADAPSSVPVGESVSASAELGSLAPGDVESFEWTLEQDGSTVDTGTGSSYTSEPLPEPGQYSLSVTVTAADGRTGSASTTVEATADLFFGEAGVATFEQSGPDAWTQVSFGESLEDPVVVPGPAQFNGTNPTTVRGRNVTSDGFELQIDEWAYLDDWHTEESVPWVALEAGTHTIDGQTVEAGTAEVGSDFTNVSLSGEYSNTPVVITACMSRSDSQPVTTRQRPPSGGSFDVRLQTEEAAGSASTETVHYIAADPTESGPLVAWRRGQVTDDWSTISYDGFDSPPVVVASQQTFNGNNTATLRYRNRTADSIDMFVEEEQSKDDETYHIEEVVGWVAVPSGPIGSVQRPEAK